MKAWVCIFFMLMHNCISRQIKGFTSFFGLLFVNNFTLKFASSLCFVRLCRFGTLYFTIQFKSNPV